MTKSEFIYSIAENAKTVCKERNLGYPQYATCVAQACCESAYGQSSIMSRANAYFGIKANKNWVNVAKYGGKVYNAKTKECYDGKSYTTINDCFRAYNSLTDSVRDYFDLMYNKRYASSLSATTVEDCIRKIKEGGYATAPNYVSTIMKFYDNVRTIIDEIWNVGAPTVAVKDLNTIVDEVINGLWGVGEDRKNRLAQAGYNYNEVQLAVNAKILGKPIKTVDELAREVIAGKWGVGADRKKRLVNDGYNYDAIQKRVNQILGGR